MTQEWDYPPPRGRRRVASLELDGRIEEETIVVPRSAPRRSPPRTSRPSLDDRFWSHPTTGRVVNIYATTLVTLFKIVAAAILTGIIFAALWFISALMHVA